MDHPHVIQRLVLEIDLPRQDNAFAIQNRVNAHCQAVINRVLDEVCEEVSKQVIGPDQFLRIEKLEIDLGTTRLEDLEEALTARVGKVFLEALTSRAHRIQRLQVGHRAPGAASVVAGKEGIGRQFPMAPASPEADSILSPEGFELELIGHFLRTGTLPWWAEGSLVGSPEQALAALLKEAPDEARILIAEEIKDERVRHRLIYQFSDLLIAEIMGLLTPGRKRSVRGWVEDLTAIYQQGTLTGVAAAAFRLAVWDVLLAEAPAIRQEKFDEKELLRAIVGAISRRHALSEVTILQSLQRGVVRRGLSRGRFESPFVSLIETGLLERGERHPVFPQQAVKSAGPADAPSHESRSGSRGIPAGVGETALTAPDQTEAPREPGQGGGTEEEGVPLEERRLQKGGAGFRHDQERPGRDDKVGDAHTPGEKKMPHDAPNRGEGLPGAMEEPLGAMRRDEALPRSHGASATADAMMVAVQEIGVQNAGLVLLWPYWNHFFKALGMLKGDRFVDETAAVRAVHLLQYLVTGETETPEYLLPLNKLLCGRNMIAPVMMEISISDGEISECEDLLAAAIAHWKALKNTSIDGFRRSFLQRNGVLTERDDTWLLRVESQAHDLLLERLPWGISMIKLSWMEKMLVVEW